MELVLVAPFDRLAEVLTHFARSVKSMQITEPPAANARWRREVQMLAQFEARLRTASKDPSQADALQHVVRGLTQLARSQDGLQFEKSAGAPLGQLRDERQMVVLAAWQLLQLLEQGPAPGPVSQSPATSGAAAGRAR